MTDNAWLVKSGGGRRLEVIELRSGKMESSATDHQDVAEMSFEYYKGDSNSNQFVCLLSLYII